MNVIFSARPLVVLSAMALCLTVLATAEAAEVSAASDCPTFTKELMDVCTNVIDKRVAGPCGYGLNSLTKIREEHGEGFLTTAGACRDALTELREGLARQDGANSTGTPWHDACPKQFASLKARCLDKITTGTPEEACPSRMLQLEIAVRRGEDGAMPCRLSLPARP